MIFNMAGGGAGGAGGGATLVVSSPANVSVTASKDDKSYTKNSGSLGSTIFKGLTTGIWSVTISGNGQTATRTVEITADYAITIAFFSATINIAYPANSTCTVTNSVGQVIASDTNTTSSEKTFAAIVGATGTYTVTATANDGSGDEASETVEITTEGQRVSVELSYGQFFYNKGDEYTSITGGWIKGTSSGALGSFTKNADNMAIVTGSNTVMIIGTSNAIDMTPYKSITIVFESATVGTGVSQCIFGLHTNLNSDTPFAAQVRVSGLEATLDVSSINAAYKIALYNGSNNNVKVQSVKGEFA